MTTHDLHAQVLAAALAILAGYVDASGFLASGGFFASFMSGNSTRMAIGIAEVSQNAVLAGALIAAFLGGVVVGALCGRRAGSRQRPAVLGLVAVALALAAGAGTWHALPAVLLMAFAMGVANNIFTRSGEVSLGVTYFTGNLVKLGQRIAAALIGEDRFGWLPYLGLWFAFVFGVGAGALAYPQVGLEGIWAAAIAAAVLAAWEWRHAGGGL